MKLHDFITCPADRHHIEEYKQAQPFPHIIIDDFLTSDVLNRLVIPDVTPNWYKYDNEFEKKRATDKMSVMGTSVSALMMFFNSQIFVDWIEKLTGINGIIVDPHFRGGGIHAIEPQGMLSVHKDFNIHEKLQVFRRINMIIYLNKNWSTFWGGELELWNKEMTAKIKSIDPIWNRAVIFDTSGDNYHGHPNPLKCPEDRKRVSLAWYAYTSKPAPGQEMVKPHSTKFQLRPFDEKTPETLKLLELRNRGRLASNV